VKVVATRSGIDGKRLRNFRDNINRGRTSADVTGSYREHLAKVRKWPTREMLTALDAMRGFVT
jgi:hypothetical protein